MNKLNQIFKCSVCGNIVEILHVGAGQLICCGQLMEALQEKTQDAGLEKHVPVIEKTEKGIKIEIGNINTQTIKIKKIQNKNYQKG